MTAAVRCAVFVLICLLAIGCGIGADSAGPGGDAPPEWTLSREPTLQIGLEQGPSEYSFASVRSTWRQADGAVLVAESGARELRVFGAAGEFVRTIGAQGEGPGEFASIDFAGPYRGDSILVWDSRARRVTVFDGEGRLGRTQTLSFLGSEPPEGTQVSGFSAPRFFGTFGDGRMVITPPSYTLASDADLPEGRPIWSFSPDGEPLTEIGTFRPSPSPLSVITSDMLALLGPGNFPSPPFQPGFRVAVGETQLFLGPGSTYEIHVLAEDGTERRVLRSSHRDLTVDDAAREAYLNEQRRRFVDRPQEALEEFLSRMPFPESLPPYSALHVDSEDHLWVQDYALPGRAGSWSVFDPEGDRIATVTTPAGFEIHDIGGDHLLGVWTDPLDVPYVREYSLLRD